MLLRYSLFDETIINADLSLGEGLLYAINIIVAIDSTQVTNLRSWLVNVFDSRVKMCDDRWAWEIAGFVAW